MKIINFLIIFIFLFYFIFEKIKNDSSRKKLKYLIHVNGIRGKSTVTRLIDAGLREAGYRVFSKITGTSPRIIDTNGVEKEILRRGKANIKEQINAIKWANREKAEILILECMAVNPELQKISEEKILNADITVITNVREDHLDEMGSNLDEIAKSLAKTIPNNGKLFTSDEKYFSFFQREAAKKNSTAVLSNDLQKEYEKIDFPANVALALAVCKNIGVKEELALNGMKKYKKDSGVLKVNKIKIKDKNIMFINAMAANDPMSTEIILEKIKLEPYWKEHKKILLLNNRKDRISRGEQHVNLIKKIEIFFDEIIIFGENKLLLKKLFIKEKINLEKVRLEESKEFLSKLEDKSLIFATGNICGKGQELIDFIGEKSKEGGIEC